MFARSTLFVAVAALFAVASADQCNTGSIQCCNSVHDSKSSALSGLFNLLGINAGDVTGQVGVTCSPISAVGVGGDSCNASPVCCENNNFNGLVALGCVPISLSL
ncbi:fungal hydrophobin [Punctularia strigosozonata HHB-11173 SS5]|uniref:fungal hydrophobin n=1 Tax=Punctularia strigosozonata (strain HHB-11173) TaxID=741275 RepID=UPI000441640D|nr:fungal hydrophobin [Punctularia strigosozonata HHB-11173 SS5]EIN05963.1 fungal hydrophobin [Punctularia strigosozonata HHB-11173 SS5]